MTPKWPWTNVSHLGITGTAKSQISISFVLQPAVFHLQSMKQAANDPKMTLGTKKLKVPYVYPTTYPSSKFPSVLFYGQPF